MTEDERAAQYRLSEQAREDAALRRWQALSGSQAAYQALLAKQQPVRRDAGWDPLPRVRDSERAANG